MPDMSSNPSPPKIRFNETPTLGKTTNGASVETPSLAPTATAAPTPKRVSAEPIAGISAAGSSKIRTFGGKTDHVEKWLRDPNAPGAGATHVRTFHSKLNNESLLYMDEQINEWLAKHPEMDVKFVSSTVGMFAGKLKEPAMICQVWV